MKKTDGKTECREIIDAIERIKAELCVAKMNFNMAEDEALIDCYIYEISALNSKYRYFLKKAKRCGIVAEGFDEVTA